MKSVLKKLLKGKNKFFNIFLLLALVAVVGVLYKYNFQKSILSDSMSNNVFANAGKVESAAAPSEQAAPAAAAGAVQPVATTDHKPDFLGVSGVSSGNKPTNVGNTKPVMDPKELLPTDTNNEWSSIVPNMDLKNIGMLKAGQNLGIDTIGSSLRNPNLQLRSEPTIPKNGNIGPWNNSTMEPDTNRRGVEIA